MIRNGPENRPNRPVSRPPAGYSLLLGDKAGLSAISPTRRSN
jgi:hypothetical protein